MLERNEQIVRFFATNDEKNSFITNSSNAKEETSIAGIVLSRFSFSDGFRCGDSLSFNGWILQQSFTLIISEKKRSI